MSSGGNGQPAGGDEPLVDIRDVFKTYYLGEYFVPAVCGITMTIPRGQFLAIMGPSGSGKSTFMYLLGCLDRCDGGTYRLAGREITGLSKRELAELRNQWIGFVFQSFNLLSRTTVLDNVALPLTYTTMRRRERRRRAAAMLDRVGLTDRLHHHSNQLSGGQQQRVAIARALVTEPVLLLADEPTGNLDTRTGKEIMELLASLNRESGLTIGLVTHEPEIAAFAHRTVTFRDGQINSDVMHGDGETGQTAGEAEAVGASK